VRTRRCYREPGPRSHRRLPAQTCGSTGRSALTTAYGGTDGPTDWGLEVAPHPTTRLLVSGHRFLMRRVECALLGRDIHAVNAPIRAPMRSLLAGSLLAIVVLTGAAVLAVLRPQPALADAPIVMGKQSGALYVRLGETLHPVLNLSSARLILKTNVDPLPIP